VIPYPENPNPSCSDSVRSGRSNKFIHPCGLVVSLLALATVPTSGADLLKWDITGSRDNPGSGPAAPASLGVSGSEMNGGGSQGNTTSPSSTWNRTFAFYATLFEAMAAGNYFSFTTSADAGYTVSVSGITGLNLKRTSTGATSAGLFYSTDNVNFTQTGSDHTVTTAGSSAGSAFDDDMAITPIVMNGGETIYWRVVVAGAVDPATSTGGRTGIGKAEIDDIVFTGTSVPDVAVHNLLWTGSGGSDWNTTPANTNWADIDDSNNPAPFVTNDNVTIDSAATIAVDVGGVSPGNILVNASTGAISLSGGAITGLFLTKSGASTLSIDGSNSFPAGVSLEGGILTVENSDAVGTGIITLNGGTLNTPNAVTLVANAVSVGTSGGVIDTDEDVTFSDSFSASGADIEESNHLTKTGAGVLTLSKTGSTAFGAQSNVGALGTSIDFDITSGGVIFSGSGSRYLGNICTWDAPVTLEGGKLMLHGSTVDGTGAIAVTANSTIESRFNRGACSVDNAITLDGVSELSLNAPTGDSELTINGVIDGSGNLIKIGNGVAILGGENSYTGTTVVESGTLRVGVGTGGSLGAGDVILNLGTSIGRLEFRQDDELVVPNNISGVGNVRMIGATAAVTRLTGILEHSGTTTVDEGTLLIDGDGSLLTGDLTVTEGGFLGGNGELGARVLLENNGGLSVSISDWTGAAGVGYTDLLVDSIEAASLPLAINIDATGLVNFTESSTSFTFINTAGGIFDFVPGTVTITAPGFAGLGTWSVAQVDDSLVLTYTLGSATDYDDWAGASGFNLVGGPNDDDDNDGISNEDEYAFGLDPTSGGSVSPSAMETKGTFTYTRRNSTAYSTGLSYSYGYSTTLDGTWTPFTPESEVSDDGDPVEKITITVPASLLSNERLFIQVTTD
jgi:autotransporter-associated beta strand protein